MKNKGFTLVEISIVIVVVALIIAAILGSQTLIANAERQTIIKEFQKYNSAVSTFKQQYNQMPGDMDNASSYWSSATNGDGDGNIGTYNTECANNVSHLKLAEILDKANGSATTILSEVKNGRYLFCNNVADFDTQYFSATSNYNIYDRRGNYLQFNGLSGGAAPDGIVNAEAANFIDKKLDDGAASSGKLVAIRGGSGTAYYTSGCVDSASFTTANTEGTINYSQSDKQKRCRLIYWLSHLD
jgi:prepilin-type N-terminal cleavage/methylation domain-containing protein